MAIPLSGYRDARLLRASGQARVYEAVREADGRAVVAKVFELQGAENLEARVEHELALIRALDVDGVVEALGMQRVGDQLVLLLARIPGVDLAAFTGGIPMAIDTFL
ncbi:MAG: hypothetical protein KC457_23245, partial [Myxococcales bacterium]|nr:hypothetical protein [Myxococcales bacterium]